MYQVLIFVACLAVGFGANNTNMSITINKPSPSPTATVSMMGQSSMTVAINTTLSTVFSMTSALSMSSSITSLAPYSTTAPRPSVTPTSKPPVPKPTPKPTYGDYSVKKNDKYCLLAKLAVSFNVTYYRNETEKEGNKTIQKNVKDFAIVGMPFKDVLTNESKCGDDDSTLVVSWTFYVFTMSFRKIKDENKASPGWEVTEVSLDISTQNNSHFPNAKDKLLTFKANGDNKTRVHQLSGNLNGSYLCDIEKDYPFNENGTMIVKHAQLQPFDVQNDKKREEMFGEANKCEAKDSKSSNGPSNIVPIAVGCALAGLVLIVLIAYIIGRRKSQRGYEKV
ncbi:lysosome-associated membrane glycoprotein 1-like [Actinia tenebrosa]|uniref:Lysosome-associated membrane glycoprotein 5 n=1 Tax=Actinia tenebrosa TaxID=6105 RepID=A0A6P8HIS8_ACTTE|nr:lysosome-associated membrane glycoprotein 1-like [Actinia tenebrosa]